MKSFSTNINYSLSSFIRFIHEGSIIENDGTDGIEVVEDNFSKGNSTEKVEYFQKKDVKSDSNCKSYNYINRYYF
jgi:hypothetical protein